MNQTKARAEMAAGFFFLAASAVDALEARRLSQLAANLMRAEIGRKPAGASVRMGERWVVAMTESAGHDTRLVQAQRFKEIAARMSPSLARSGMLAAARHLEQDVRERPNSSLTVRGWAAHRRRRAERTDFSTAANAGRPAS